mgnify:CR=1 FL=1
MKSLFVNGVLICMAAVLSLGTGLWGCGKKDWPEPRLHEDRFQWTQLQHQRYDHCLDVRALLDGAASNLRFVTLEWMEMENGEDCPDCPFTATGRARLDDATAEFKRQNGVIRIVYCGWEPNVSYRWRLVGGNKYVGLGTTISEVQFSR